jgi:hypothetical protein
VEGCNLPVLNLFGTTFRRPETGGVQARSKVKSLLDTVKAPNMRDAWWSIQREHVDY